MKTLYCTIFCLIGFFVNAQFSDIREAPSKHEVSFEFRGSNGAFLPNLSYNYYRTEDNIFHFSPLISFGSSPRRGQVFDLNWASFGIDFWNEYRIYLRRNSNFYFSHGFTFNAGYSFFDYSEFISATAKGNSLGLGAGYKFGIGYKINRYFTLNLQANPRLHHSRLNYDLQNGNQFNFQIPVTFGINYRF